jgi:hypothetical protein
MLGRFLTGLPESNIDTYTTVFFVDDALTVSIDPDTVRTSARHDVPPPAKGRDCRNCHVRTEAQGYSAESRTRRIHVRIAA